MDKSKQPGISFDGVVVKSLQFDRSTELPETNIDISFEYNFNFSDKKENLITELTCRITEKNNSFKLQATILGFFSIIEGQENMNLENFAEVNAPAHLVPYIRELISSTTLRAGMAPLIIPPVNVQSAIREQEKKISE